MSAVLTKDELTLLALLSRGLSTDRVARQLGLSERTVRRHTRAICDRLGVATPVEAVVWAARRKLV
ncbi:helix-turn-helix transcriptional regulator [Nocardioides gansuensis]|uniref:Helix-turn-helix transcriptional regulator n=1 Tax=Nocardioides gansuensis TaxID=2138300 RepID=A0A2T8F6W8_9ACTN|nr:LuxR C-terminal-related transcriptional regulator [Nocardioides gansuensis]PVG81456.1 helix-turn-helix transcriptional regulator [Nocardioides gansuensis]